MADTRGPRKKRGAGAETDASAELRREAEARLDGSSRARPVPADPALAAHELRVHQIELEMQNEELRRAQLELDTQRAKYFELFDLAPVGYLTVSETGMVRDVNVTAARLLGAEPRRIVGQPFSTFVADADHDAYYLCLRRLGQTGEPQTFDLRLRRAAGAAAAPGDFWARLDARLEPAPAGETHLTWVTFTDVTPGKQAEAALRESEQRLLERSSRGERLNAALNEVNARLNASFELDAALEDVLGIARAALDCDAAVLSRAAPGEQRLERAVGLEPRDGGFIFDQELLAAVSADAPTVFTRSGDPHTPWPSRRLGLTEAIVGPFPLHWRGDGALLLGRRTAERGFDDLSVDFVRRLALALALLLANAARFEAEHHIAETLQEALLRMPASIRGLEFSHLYRSATTATRVGGDFFDVFEMTEGRVGVIMGDVSGKGLEAAVLTSIIKDTVKAYAHDTRSAAVAVKRANAALAEAAGPPTFASLFYAVVDGARGLLSYCNAGHPPPVILAADGSLRLLGGTSPVIGAFPGSTFAQRTVRLAPDETVLLYTDGVTEARDPDGTFFEEPRLHAAVRSAGAAGVSGLPAAIFEAVMTFSAGHLTDDIALLAFRHAGALLPER